MAIRNLGFFDLAHLAAVVVAAVRANLMRRLRLVALRTRADRHRLERVVRSTLRRARLRMPAFGIGHLNSPSDGSTDSSAAPAADLPASAGARTRCDCGSRRTPGIARDSPHCRAASLAAPVETAHGAAP